MPRFVTHGERAERDVPRGSFRLRALIAFVAVACCEARSASETPPPRGAAASTSAPASQRTRPRDGKWADRRERMVRDQIEARGVRDPRVLAAMRSVPRHWFVPEHLSLHAYDDGPLPIGYDQTISQPYIVALMTDLIALRPNEKVLEIGTGSGYQAAVLSELTPHVFTIEIVQPLARRTMRLLERKGYDTITVRIGNGFRGWPEEAPFDAILVTCAAPEPPPALVEQLAVGGRMCIPVGEAGGLQELMLYTKRADGSLDRRTVAPVAFVPMTGESQRSRRR